MKKIFGFLALCLMFPLQGLAQQTWQEGKHYEVIRDIDVEKREVTEFFSFWCPACFRFETIVKQIKRELPEGVAFNKVHVNFMGAATPEIQEMVTQAMIVGRAMRKESEVNEAIFNTIHKKRAAITTEDDLKEIFNLLDIDSATFNKYMGNFGVKTLFRQNQKTLADYRNDVRSVPTFIVNGKYKANALFSEGMTMDEFVDLVVWLSQKD